MSREEWADEPRRHVVMCAAACHPDLGSEFAVGWQWVTAAAQRYRVTVVTGDAAGSREAIRQRLVADPLLGQNLQFRFLPWFDPPQSRLLERLWIAVPPIYYFFYRKWLARAAEVIRQVLKDEPVDLVHQVTYICFREPGFAAELGVPFVWGPIGGTQNVPWSFLPSLGIVDGGRHAARNVLNWFDLNMSRKVARTLQRAAALAAIASDTQAIILRRFGRSSVVIPATSCGTNIPVKRPLRRPGPTRFVFSGLHIARKGLPFALDALAKLRDLPWSLDVLGAGPLTERWRHRALSLGIADRVNFRGFLPRAEAVSVMGEADAFIFPSLQEGWPTVVIEALSLGLPVVAPCHHGMADMIDESCGFTLPVTRPADLVASLATALRTLASDQHMLARLSDGALARARVFSREAQIEAIAALYDNALHAGSCEQQ
jgi:glycosyltransferase involved in cell wall biosynthesis